MSFFAALSAQLVPVRASGCTDAGATTLGIADRASEQLRPELRDALDDYYRVDDLGDYDQLTRAMGWFIHRHGLIDRIDSLNEHWLETEAAAAHRLQHLGHHNRTRSRAVKRKSLMKKRFVACRPAGARGTVCRTGEVTAPWIAEVGYPVVAKPDVGVGAAQTYKLENDADIERYLDDKPASTTSSRSSSRARS